MSIIETSPSTTWRLVGVPTTTSELVALSERTTSRLIGTKISDSVVTPPSADGDGPDLPFPDVPARNSSPVDLLKVPCLVQRLLVRGNQRTKRALIDAEMAAALAGIRWII